ncbi:MAG TPA: hypothetical protein VFM25_08245 [Verrucomicrobiae bacterium]|nr:hypothetical protein [Verrucomicrobiae bacterium]
MTLARRDCPAATVHLVEQFYERIYAFLRRFTGADGSVQVLGTNYSAWLVRRDGKFYFERPQNSIPTP